MECLKVLLCAGLASVGRTAPQFDAFDVVPASPLHERDPLLTSFDGLPPSFGFGSSQSLAGFPADLYPSAADLGFGGVSPPGHGLPAATGFDVPGLATPLPAAFPFATPGSQQTYTAASADGRLVPVAAAAQTPVAGPTKTGPPAQSPRDYYDNDGINTTPSPPRPVFGAVPDPAVVLKPPPLPADTERPGHPDPVSPGVAFAGESSRQFAGPSQAADSDDDDSPNPLPGRPFDYSKPFPRPINVVALGPPTEQQKYAAVPQTYATSVSPTPGGFRVDDTNNNNNPPNSVSGHYYRQQSDNNNNDNNVVRPTLGGKPAQSVAGHHGGSAVFSDNSPNSVSGHYYRQQSDNNDNVYGQTVSPKPVQSVTVLQPYGGQVSGANGAAPDQPSANGYGDAAVQNSFNELAAGFLSHGAAGKSGSFVAAGGDSNSISANNKRESIGGYGIEYKRD